MVNFSHDWREKLFVVNNFMKSKCVYIFMIALMYAHTKFEKVRVQGCCIRADAVLKCQQAATPDKVLVLN
jgi:hypothetical protein